MKTTPRAPHAKLTAETAEMATAGLSDPQRRRALGMAGAALGAGLLPLAGPAWAQPAYPDRPVTMIVPFPPGGVADTVARPVADALGRALGQPVAVENRAGGGGGVGISAASRAQPDGYTVLMSLSSISILPEADKILGRRPQFTLDQFIPIARFTADPTVLMVRTESPWQTLEDFLRDMRANPGKFNFGSSGNYGTMHVPMEMLKGAAQFQMTHVPYTGAGPAIAALLGGQVDAIASGPSSIASHVRAGRLRPLAHWGDKPLQSLPEVPALKDKGFDVQFAQWSALFVPAGTPAVVVQRLREAARQAAADPLVVETINRAGSPIEYQDAPAFEAYWKADAAVMRRAVQAIGKVD
jgi:tripartite-type tricarboxylate transporter receptor subunit TctC